ncbi:MAG: PIN domain-containing protein [Thermoanaerobaculia bacterium]|nr:PIN domain-containing protein [Thermoanaerobaculia bacterium]
MRSVVIDTNALVSFLTDRHPEQQDEVRRIFQAAVEGALRLVVPLSVLSETVFVLTKQYGISPSAVAEVFRQLLAEPRITVGDHFLDLDDLLSLWPDSLPSFVDSLFAAAVLRNGYEFATFDQKLSRFLLDRRGRSAFR